MSPPSLIHTRALSPADCAVVDEEKIGVAPIELDKAVVRPSHAAVIADDPILQVDRRCKLRAARAPTAPMSAWRCLSRPHGAMPIVTGFDVNLNEEP